MLQKKQIATLSAVLISIFFLVGIVGISFSDHTSWFIAQTPFLLLLGGVLLFLNHQHWSKPLVLVMVGIFIAGISIEAIGVNTGKIFGHYTYGDTLSWQLFGTPLLIGLNWLSLVYCVYIILQPLTIASSLKALVGALVLTIFDFNMEPIAIKMGMWTWDFVSVPLLNYFAWFVISAFMLLAFYKVDNEKSNNFFAAYYFISQVVFFFLLHLLWV